MTGLGPAMQSGYANDEPHNIQIARREQEKRHVQNSQG